MNYIRRKYYRNIVHFQQHYSRTNISSVKMWRVKRVHFSWFSSFAVRRACSNIRICSHLPLFLLFPILSCTFSVPFNGNIKGKISSLPVWSLFLKLAKNSETWRKPSLTNNVTMKIKVDFLQRGQLNLQSPMICKFPQLALTGYGAFDM